MFLHGMNTRIFFLESLSFSKKNKAMEIFASHVHLVFRSAGEYKPGDLLGDFKSYSSR